MTRESKTSAGHLSRRRPMRRPFSPATLLLAAAFALVGCRRDAGRAPRSSTPGAAPTGTASAAAAPPDPGEACRARVAVVTASAALPGAAPFEAVRSEILGRARGEPMVFVREPAATPEKALAPAWLASRRAFERGKPGSRVRAAIARHRAEPEALRALLLREGYVYSSEPEDALALVSALRLADLFGEPSVWLARGGDVRELYRDAKRKDVVYRYADGPMAGRAADVLFGDRVGLHREDLGAPLHRDLRALAETEGFDRARITHRTQESLVADLRFGERWATAVLAAEGARLRLECVAAGPAEREGIAAFQAAEAPRLRAMRRLREVVTEEVHEGYRFDRPEGEKSPDRDGELRPIWLTAYLQGRAGFEVDGTSYPVFDGEGKPWPPQVCVDFVLDTYERTSGTWFRPRVAGLGREKGRLDFNETGIENRRGVIAFGKFAEAHPELFAARRFEGEERIPFARRSRFFAFLTEHADLVRPGDVVAIQGLKADERIHQHAILVESVDPVTGFPMGLADQMKRPRRRTWEGIMAEAPKRSLLYRLRPSAELFQRMDPG